MENTIYIEYSFSVSPLQPATDILIAELGEAGFESFVENETGVLAYIQKEEFEEAIMDSIEILKNANFDISFEKKEIEQENWNATWEKNFTPIQVAEQCMVRAPFHEKPDVPFDIIIEPKMSFGTGHPDREPLTTPMHQASYLAGVGAAFATVAALLGRDITRKGQLVDVAEGQVVAVLLSGYHLPTYIYRGVAGWRSGNRMRLGLFPNCVLPCKDGYVCIDAPQLEQYQRFLALMGDQDWVNEPRYRDRRAMTEEYPEEAESLITPWFMDHTKEEILAICLENRVPCAPVRTFYEVLDDVHLGGRGFFQDVMHPEAGTLKYPGYPYHFSDAPCRSIMPAPLLGQHNLDIFCGELGLDPSRLSDMAKAGVI